VSARLWVTGLGLITPLGADVESTWTRLVRGDRAIREIQLFDVHSQRARVAGEVEGYRPASDPAVTGAGWSRSSAMAVAAAAEAMRAAAVDVRSARVGLVIGGTTGGMFENEQALARLHAEPQCRAPLTRMLSHPLSAIGDLLHQCLGPFARVRVLASACSSGANAIVVGASWLLARDVDIVVTGGSDALCRLTLSGFNALGAIDPEPCRPFDRRRRGTSLGEGAGFLVLERAEDLRARATDVSPIAELAGWSMGAEAHHVTNPAPDGALVASLIERALSRAGLRPYDVDYLNAHGTSTPLGDRAETTVVKKSFGDRAYDLPISSIKAALGHMQGACGAVEVGACCLAIRDNVIPATINYEFPDPECDLDYVPNEARHRRVDIAVSNSLGFGGRNTTLVLERYRNGHVGGRNGSSEDSGI